MIININKKIFKTLTVLILPILLSLFFIIQKTNANNISFEPFEYKDYNINKKLTQENQIKQIQAFSFKTLEELNTCEGISKDKQKDDHQVTFCSNFYEADRLRLAYLYELNGNQNLENDKKNKYWSFIYGRHKTDSTAYYGASSFIKNKSDYYFGLSSVNFENIKIMNTISKDIQDNYKYLHAVNKSFKQCEKGYLGNNDFSFSDRLFSINITKQPEDYTRLTGFEYKQKNKKDEEKEENNQTQVNRKTEYVDLNCGVLKILLNYYTKEDNIKFSLDNQEEKINSKWLPFTKIEKKYFIFDKNKLQKMDEMYIYQRQTECGFTGIKTIFCTFSRINKASIDAGETFLSFFLRLQLSPMSLIKIKTIWVNFKTIANIILIIIFLIMIFSQLTGFKLNQLGIKILLPRIIIIAIFVNLSLIIFSGLLDISTILGDSIHSLFNVLKNSLNISDYQTNVWGDILKIMAIAMIGLFAIFNFFLFFMLMIAMIIGLFITFILIAMRNIILLITIIVSPLFIVLSIFPKTEKFFKAWIKTLPILFLLYPIAIILKSVGDILSVVMNNAFPTLKVLSLLFLAIPFYILPFLLMKLFKSYGTIGEGINKLIDKGKNSYSTIKNSNFMQTINTRNEEKINKARRGYYKKTLNPLKIPFATSSFYNKGLKKITPGLYYSKINSQPNNELRKNVNQIKNNIGRETSISNAIACKIIGEQYKGPAPSDANGINTLNTFAINPNKEESLAIMELLADDHYGNEKFMSKVLDNHIKNHGIDQDFYETLNTMKLNYAKEGRYDNAAKINTFLTENHQDFASVDKQFKAEGNDNKYIKDYINTLENPVFTKTEFTGSESTPLNTDSIIGSFVYLKNKINTTVDPKEKKYLKNIYENRFSSINDSQKSKVEKMINDRI